MKKFKRLDEFYGDLTDWDERPHGDGYILIPGTPPSFMFPPSIILVGYTKGGIIYSPPKNWFSWRPKYPSMKASIFKNRYIRSINPPRILYKLCNDCGRNCILVETCVFCLHQLSLTVEGDPQLKKQLTDSMGCYLNKLYRRAR